MLTFRLLAITSAIETLFLIVIVTNRLTVHWPAITQTGGPIHGFVYLATIAIACLLPTPKSAKWLSVIPGIGGFLSLRSSRARGRSGNVR